jgi:hypothetical protein
MINFTDPPFPIRTSCSNKYFTGCRLEITPTTYTHKIRTTCIYTNFIHDLTLEDRYGVRHLVVWCHRQPKKRTEGDGGSRKKLAAARRRMIRRAGTARRKVRGRKGPTVEKRRLKGPECNNGIRN